MLTLEGHMGALCSVAFSPDGTTFASGLLDNTVELWRVSDGALLRTLTGHTSWVSAVAFSPDGATLASGSFDGTIRFWGIQAEE
jgi:WD40 repeat protein